VATAISLSSQTTRLPLQLTRRAKNMSFNPVTKTSQIILDKIAVHN
jgi:hypothetical protein